MQPWRAIFQELGAWGPDLALIFGSNLGRMIDLSLEPS
jgi:hypothetical protein